MNKSIADKLGVKSDMRTFFFGAPEYFADIITLPSVELKTNLHGEFDYIHFFVITQKEFHTTFERLKQHLKKGGMLWVSWPKAKQKQTDLSITKVIEIGYDYGMVESKSIRIDSIWSAIKFTFPKEGKVYNNSYGKLK